MSEQRRYFDNFNDYQSMVASFMDAGWDYDKREQKTAPLPEGFPADADILFASYGTEEAYSGDAIVVFRRGDDLFIVNGGHCSCNGLEGQWNPALTTVEALRAMIPKEGDGWNAFREHTKEAADGFAAIVGSL